MGAVPGSGLFRSSPLQRKQHPFMLCPSQHTQVGFTVLTELAAVGLTVVPCANMKARPLQNMRLSLPQIAQLFARLKTKHSQRSRQNGLKFRTK